LKISSIMKKKKIHKEKKNYLVINNISNIKYFLRLPNINIDKHIFTLL